MSYRRPTARELYLSPDMRRTEMEQDRAELEFFRRVRLKNGVAKTTHAARLDDLNVALLPLLPAARPLELMDVAISSGISTLEWMHSLSGAGVEFRMVAGDVSLKAYLLSYGRLVEVLLDKNGHPLHIDLFGRGMAGSGESLMLGNLAAGIHRGLKWLIRGTPIGTMSPAMLISEPASWGRISSQPLTLVTPRLKDTEELELVEDDLLAENDPRLQGRFHALRAANILNHAYFDDTTILRITTNLRARLAADGLLIVCRTGQDGANHGTVFRLNPDRSFSVAGRLGNGSEIEALVLGLQ